MLGAPCPTEDARWFSSRPPVFSRALRRRSGPSARARTRGQQCRAAIAPPRSAHSRSCASCAPNLPEDPLEFAQLLIQAGEAPQAVWVLEEAVRNSPERDDLRIAWARTALLVADAASAHAALEPIDENSEKHPEALVLRSQAELRLGDAKRAMATLELAEKLYPDRIEARLVRIGALLQERRFDEARRAVEEARVPAAAAEQPDALRPFEIALYEADAESGKTDAAVTGLRSLVAQKPYDAQVWQSYAQVMIRADRLEEVTKELESELEERPDTTELRRSSQRCTGLRTARRTPGARCES